jgi:hypothetical protein
LDYRDHRAQLAVQDRKERRDFWGILAVLDLMASVVRQVLRV